jgi:hypothetical protein
MKEELKIKSMLTQLKQPILPEDADEVSLFLHLVEENKEDDAGKKEHL